MDSFEGKLAVVTGGGSGMGRELVRQLAAQGCSVAACDLNADSVAAAAAIARGDAPPGDLRRPLAQANADFGDKAPLSAAEAVAIILDGVRSGSWRILVGEDAKKLDAAVRAKPEAAYEYAQLGSWPDTVPGAEPRER